jgi:hypothetical protein
MHEAEFRRCLLQADVSGIMRVWRATAPHLAQLTEKESLLALHMARVDAKSIPKRLKEYSLRLLEEHGIEKHNGKWTQGPPTKSVFSESVGIASMSMGPRTQWNHSVMNIMRDGLYKAFSKGVVEPVEQRFIMLDERKKFKFRHNR